jgi:poly(A) polymerase
MRFGHQDIAKIRSEAYLVGGAVRDMMWKHSQDFDIATSASPRQILRLFWNARIIGKRFKLVHMVFRISD